MPGVGGGNVQNGPNNQQQVCLFFVFSIEKEKYFNINMLLYIMFVNRGIKNGGIIGIVFDLFTMAHYVFKDKS